MLTRKVSSELGRWELLKLPPSSRKDTSQVRLLHELAKIHATFDDPNLVSHAGLVPVMALAQRARAGLGDRAAEHVRIARPCGVNTPVKIAWLPGIPAQSHVGSLRDRSVHSDGTLTTIASCVDRAITTTASVSGDGFSSRCGTCGGTHT